MIRVGFFFPELAAWTGGLHYLRNLVESLLRLPDPGVEPVLLLGTRGSLPDGFPETRVERLSLLDRWRPPWAAYQVCRRILGADLFTGRALREKGVQVLSHSASIGRSGMPVIGWIPDFQHLALPGFFSDRERKNRDAECLRQLRHCSRVVLSSRAALEDLGRKWPGYARKARVLHFVGGPLAPMPDVPDRGELEQRYGFSGPYFYLPNQFWRHKNHRTAVRALGLLNAGKKQACIIATGNTKDYRSPGYFPELMDEVNGLSLSEDFRVPGMVPYRDVVGLMKHAVAVINPSLFEGWSTTVEEAKSMGKRVILSDIPVHREQDPPDGLYFDPRNPQALASAMASALDMWDAEKEITRQKAAAGALDRRVAAFAREYQRIVLESI